MTATPDLLVRGFELQHARQFGGLTVINPSLPTAAAAVHEPAAPYGTAPG